LVVALDTNVLCYALDPAYDENVKARKILLALSSQRSVAVNPTVIHETYHTLVFGQKWLPETAKERLQLILGHPNVEFHNQTKQVSNVALSLAVRYSLGGRDSLIAANCIVNKIPKLLTHDSELLAKRSVMWRDRILTFEDPIRAVRLAGERRT
jgi:predicted nucleic acid-binding protein